MSEWFKILKPVEIFVGADNEDLVFAKTILIHKEKFPDIEGADIAIVGIPEYRNSLNNHGTENSLNEIRKYLYSLANRMQRLKIVDLGDITLGNTPEDTYIAASEVIAELLKKSIFPIILGGSNDILYANYLAYEKIGQIVNIASIDSDFDISTPESQFNSKTYLNKIVLRNPNYLFNFTNIGYQSYFVDDAKTEIMQKMYFDTYRLGVVRSNLEEVEPLVRNSDIVSIDISAIRQSDSPANKNASPNGFYGEEICQFCRYVGMSDKVSSVGIYEYNPTLDNNYQSAHLIAQMIWFIIDGYYNRKNDIPDRESDNYSKFHVFNDKIDDKIVFYKSKKTGRWWMEVPYPAKKVEKFQRHYLVACSYNDYKTAMNNEIPERLWNTLKKIM